MATRHDHTSSEDGSNDGILVAKIVAMLVLGLCSCILGLLPMKITSILKTSKSIRGQSVLQLLLCFGGGALLCTTFLHLLPEMREGIEELQSKGTVVSTEFHLPELIMCCGFFLMFTVEEIIHLYLHHREKKALLGDVEIVAHRSLSMRRCSTISNKYAGDSKKAQEDNVYETQENKGQSSIHQEQNPNQVSGHPNGVVQGKKNSTDKNGVVQNGHIYDKPDDQQSYIIENQRISAPYIDPNELNTNPRYENVVNPGVDSSNQATSRASYLQIVPETLYEDVEKQKTNHVAIGHDLKHIIPAKEDGLASAIRGLMVVLALSIHELFEGLAVGLQSTTEMVYYMMGAVSAHKLVIAFCVGMELVSSGTRRLLIVVYVVTFAIVSPIGIGVGLALTAESGEEVSGGAPNVILQGLATGTLLYVVFFEILLKERKGGPPGLLQLFAIATGFGIMFALLVTVGAHDHDHDHGHTH